MFSKLNEGLDRYTLIEFEGRFISSIVAMFVYYMHERSTESAVTIFMVSQMIDLVRCAYRRHVLEPGIVAHHCMSLMICTAFLNSVVAVEPEVVSATQKLLGMEFTNPWLHGSWMLSKMPSFPHKHTIEMALFACTIVLWPVFRLGPSFLAAVQLASHHASASSLAGLLCVLQFVWFYKLFRRFAQMVRSDVKDL